MSAVFLKYRGLFSRAESTKVSYQWDTFRDTEYFYFLDEEITRDLIGLADTAIGGFGLAALEWTCARLWSHVGDGDVMEYVDAAWADILRENRCQYLEFDRDEWRGPALAPLYYVQLIASEIVVNKSREGWLLRANWGVNLARHVLGGERRLFEAWYRETVARLTMLHPFGVLGPDSIFEPTFPEPEPVAPAAYLHDAAYDPADSEEAIKRHVIEYCYRNKYIEDDRAPDIQAGGGAQYP